MKNITINKGNILKYSFNLSYKMASILGAVNSVFQNKSFSPFDCITDETGVWYGVSYNEIVKEIPILKMTKTTCSKNVNDLISLGFLERHWNCERLSKTFLKPSQNFRLYFETDKNEIIINQKQCFGFDIKLNLLHWIILNAIEKNAIGKFNYNFVFINEVELLKNLKGVMNSRTGYLKILMELIEYGYIERSETFRIERAFYYRAGTKFLKFKETIK